MKRSLQARLLSSLACLTLMAGCGGQGDEAAVEEAAEEEVVPFLPDSTIEQQVQARIEDDPRLDIDGVEIAVRSAEQEVTLVGEVPTRKEWSIAREIALSSPGVKTVYLDSLSVLSEERNRGTPSEAPAARS